MMADPVEASIRQFFVHWTEAWNAVDLDGFMDGYLKSEDTRLIAGDKVIVGWEAIYASNKAIFEQGDNNGCLENSCEMVRVLSEEAAVASFQWSLTVGEHQLNGFSSVVVQQNGGAWKAVLDHSSWETS